jgi:hypothetical protein
MRAGKNAVLGAAAITIASACSNSDLTAREARMSQAEPLAAATSAPLAVPSVGAAGAPVDASTPPLAVPTVQQASTAQLALGDSNELATLRGIALGAASAAGVSSPSTITAVAASDHQAAEFILCGAVINDHAPVYVIKMAGGPFTATQHPGGQPAPQGSFLTLTVDATTHRVTDSGYVNVEPDLSKIGSVAVNL